MMIKHLFIIDPLEKLNIEFDTSILIMNEALNRGHEVYLCHEEHISFSRSSVFCHSHSIKEKKFPEKKMYLFDEYCHCENFDFIHVRKDPPFDENYHSLLLILKHLKKAKVINDPLALLKFNEKESILLFPQYICETLIGSLQSDIIRFLEQVGGEGILKPIYNCSGNGVTRLSLNDQNLKEKIFELTSNQRSKVIIQRFIKKIYEGETRVFMLGENPLAVMKKIPPKGNFLANFDFGGKGEKYVLNEREKIICNTIGKFCKENGIILSALDIIDGFISEINITSPGLLVESNILNDSKYENIIIDYFENMKRGCL